MRLAMVRPTHEASGRALGAPAFAETLEDKRGRDLRRRRLEPQPKAEISKVSPEFTVVHKRARKPCPDEFRLHEHAACMDIP